MRIGPGDPFWIVHDPWSEESELEDLIWETNLEGLGNWFRGSIMPEDREVIATLTLYLDQAEAMHDAESRFSKARLQAKTAQEADTFRFGESGYMEIMDAIIAMVDNGYGVVDVMLNIGERFPKERATMVLEEARAQGVL